jgi:UDP-N-acetyl-D-mannosaminuronate dehydrogenase
MVKERKEFGIEVYWIDPLLSKEEIKRFGVKALDNLGTKVDCVIVTVAHNEFKKMTLEDLARIMNIKPVLVDVRGMFSEVEAKNEGFYYRLL